MVRLGKQPMPLTHRIDAARGTCYHPPMFPRWISLLFLLFLGYMLMNYEMSSPSQPVPAPIAQPEADYPQLHALMDGSRWMRAVNPTYKPTPEPCGAVRPPEHQLGDIAIIENAGDGEAAVCNAPIILQLIRWDASGHDTPATTVTLTLGRQLGLDALLVGMRPQERRLLVLQVPTSGYASLPGWKKGQLIRVTATRVMAAGGKNVDKQKI